MLSTFTVTTPNDSVAVAPANPAEGPIDSNGQVSLRSAIQAADALGGTNTIILPNLPGNTSTTYTLNLSDTVGDLAIKGNLTIQGAGASSTIINGAGKGRVFEIDGGTVTISGVTVTGGVAATGGGILNQGGNLTLSNDTITGNKAIGVKGANGVAGPAGATGGVGAEGGDAFGGGVDNAAGTLSIVSSLISSNSATGGTGGGGGAGGATQGANGADATSAGNMGGTGGSGRGAAGETGGHGGAGLGGGVFNGLGAQLTVAGTTFSGNSAVGGIGGVGGAGGKGVGGTGGASVQLGGFLDNPTDIGGNGGTGTGGTGGTGGQGGNANGGGLYNGGIVTVADTKVSFTTNMAIGGVGGVAGTGGNGVGGVGGATATNQSVQNDNFRGGQGGKGVGGTGGAGGTGGQAEGGALYNAPLFRLIHAGRRRISSSWGAAAECRPSPRPS